MMQYRRDVDGLRSVAVLSVIAYHYFPPILRGGFIGVDIFFVISGYLISGIIFKEIESNRFSILEFYRRRINRIFPALCCVLAATLACGWVVLFPDEYKSLGHNTLASATFVENIYLWMQTGYFDSEAAKKPLLHIWSLGVEEQFYIIYPLLLAVAHRLRFLNGKFLIACCIASLVVSMIVVGQSQSADFYLPMTRYWELSVGGILAWLEHDRGTSTPAVALRGMAATMISCLGGLAILGGFFLIDSRTTFPGGAALFPVIGAAMVIAAGPLALPNRIALSNRAAVFIGKISYPLYLWHWPLLAFLFIIDIEKPEPPVRAVLMIMAFLLAIATWLLVETPIRKRHNNWRTAAVLMVIMMTIAIASWTIVYYGGFGARNVNRINAGATVRAAGIDSPPLPVQDCSVPSDVAHQFRNCIELHSGTPQFVLLGDSKADALYHGLMQTSQSGGRWLYLGGADATTFGAPEPLISTHPAWARVQTQSRAAIDYIANNRHIHLVLYVVAMRNIYLLDDNGGAGRLLKSYDPRFLSRLQGSPLTAPAQAAVMEAVNRLVRAGKIVAILVDNPPLPSLRNCYGRLTASATLNHILDLKKQGTDRACLYPKNKYREDAKTYFNMLEAIKLKFGTRVLILDYTDFYCQENRGSVCGTSLNGVGIYGYTDHISSVTANILGKRINGQLMRYSGSQ